MAVEGLWFWQGCGLLQELIYREFFSQGDQERSIGRDPAEMMDRERAVIPDLQVVFLDTIALPVYRSSTSLTVLFTSYNPHILIRTLTLTLTLLLDALHSV